MCGSGVLGQYLRLPSRAPDGHPSELPESCFPAGAPNFSKTPNPKGHATHPEAEEQPTDGFTDCAQLSFKAAFGLSEGGMSHWRFLSIPFKTNRQQQELLFVNANWMAIIALPPARPFRPCSVASMQRQRSRIRCGYDRGQIQSLLVVLRALYVENECVVDDQL